MKYEHIVQINSAQQPELALLTREQVWRGLALRAYDPMHFNPHLEACSIREHQHHDTHEVLMRTLYFGNFEVEDVVTLHPLQETRIEVAATSRWPRSTAIARIEEPEPGSLFIRFIYEMDDDDPNEQQLPEALVNARQNAYRAADLDTVRRIRELASQPML